MADEMDADIDIEEHDLMDNPVIKKIFPDLSIIKKEITQYYENDFISSKHLKPASDVTQLQDLIDTNKEITAKQLKPKENFKSLENGIRKEEGNIIILGTKPNESKNQKIKGLQIRVENVSSYLNDSRRYCKNCLILYPNVSSYHLHRKQYHHPKILNSVNKISNISSKKQYKCDICGSSLSNSGNLSRHLKQVHKIVRKQNRHCKGHSFNQNDNTKLDEGHACFHCKILFKTQQSLIDHLYNILDPKLSETNSHLKDETNKKEQEQNCSSDKRNNTESCLEKHTHNALEISQALDDINNQSPNVKTPNRQKPFNLSLNRNKIKKMKFSQNENVIDDKNIVNITVKTYNCKDCAEQFVSELNLNQHIFSKHKMPLSTNDKEKSESSNDQMKKDQSNFNSDSNQVACKSTLFKCIKCNIYFLLAREAKCHIEHKRLPINWKCLLCQRTFKKKDKEMHINQHSFGHNFFVLSLKESELSRILYKCLNCAIHFSENNYLLHYGKCDSGIPNSLYCNVCDILVNIDDMNFHNIQHKQKKMSLVDFTVIETEIFFNNSTKDKECKVTARNEHDCFLNKLHHDPKYIFTYCQTCNCFISHLELERIAHIQGKCAQMQNIICKICGLTFTMKDFNKTHKSLHNDDKGACLQKFVFYDFKTHQKICPPLPKYPNCTDCGVYFSESSDIPQHVCNKQDKEKTINKNYKVCNFCQIKLTHIAYQLHLPFHKYKISKDICRTNEIKDENIKQIISNGNLNETTMLSTVAYDNVSPNVSTNKDSSVVIPPSFEHSFLFNCESCHITISTYQQVVRHCQDHYDYRIRKLCILQCELCPLKFDIEYYDDHKSLHLKGNYNHECEKIINFDPFYFRYDNDFWIAHIFAYVADDKKNNILESTIYQSECRLKMEIMQVGSSDLTLYKCDKCHMFINPSSLYAHAGILCSKSNKNPCAFCGLTFESLTYSATHEKVHEDPNISHKSFRIILYNKEEHEEFNKSMFESCNEFILYQCRNCDAVVDKFCRDTHQCNVAKLKKCPSCDLVFNEQDYDLHFIRHEELEGFEAQFMNVILFGKSDFKVYKDLNTHFKGVIYDFTFYKCKICELSSRNKENISQHDCAVGSKKNKCPKCRLCFSKRELNDHYSLHTKVREIDECNLNIININDTIQKITNLDKNRDVIERAKKINEQVIADVTAQVKTVEKLFKCTCGLHFLEELNAQQHASGCSPKMKILKQNCFKCDLLFTPGELFNHLLKHHRDKKCQLLSFDVVVLKREKKKIMSK